MENVELKLRELTEETGNKIFASLAFPIAATKGLFCSVALVWRSRMSYSIELGNELRGPSKTKKGAAWPRPLMEL
jgi:hypothetical protein